MAKRMLIKRFLSGFFALIGITILIFCMCRLLPGDPARAALGPWATQEMLDLYRQQNHLNDPIPIQFGYWLVDLAHGKLGPSIITEEDTGLSIARCFAATAELSIFAAVLMVVLAITLGGLAGRYADSWFDNLTRLFAYVGVSMPSFVFAILGIYFLGFILGWVPISGRIGPTVSRPPTVTGLLTIDSLIAGDFAAFVSAVRHLILPALTTAIGGIAQEIRIVRAAVAENYKKDFVSLVVSQGIPERHILFRYIMRPSAPLIVPAMCMDMALLLSHQYVTEIVFAWPGMAQYATFAILRKDLNAVVGTTIVVGILFFVFNFIADLLIYYLDPRLRLGATAVE